MNDTEIWYYQRKDGEEVGPISRDDLMSFFVHGVVERETPVWTDDDPDRRPLAELVNDPAPEPARNQPTNTDIFRFGEHGRAETSGSDTEQRWRISPPDVWRRFWARMFDTAVNWAVTGPVFALTLSERDFEFLDGMEREPTLVLVLASFFLSAWVTAPITSALTCGLTGFTPGKFVLGLKVIGSNGRPIGTRRALLREYRVLISGLGLHLLWPVIPLQRLAISEKALVRHGTLPWDAYKNVVLYRVR